MPGYADPQNLNRYAYTLNNPLRYTDPTGHMVDAGGGGGACNKKCKESYERQKQKEKKDEAETKIMGQNPNNIGQPTDPGNYVGAYYGPYTGTNQYNFNQVGGDGDCIGSVCSFSGGGVSLKYGARYEIHAYDNLQIVILHENYFIPAFDQPLMENSTVGGSVLLSQTYNGRSEQTNLGSFSPVTYGDLAQRDTAIQYWGSENFPMQLAIQVSFGAENRGVTTVYYQLPDFVP